MLFVPLNYFFADAFVPGKEGGTSFGETIIVGMLTKYMSCYPLKKAISGFVDILFVCLNFSCAKSRCQVPCVSERFPLTILRNSSNNMSGQSQPVFCFLCTRNYNYFASCFRVAILRLP